jgi:exopolysaccharide biosynthesis polyprenyl glycosylphosphotransferase
MFARLRRVTIFLLLSDIGLTVVALLLADLTRRFGPWGEALGDARPIVTALLMAVTAMIFPTTFVVLGLYDTARGGGLASGAVVIVRAVAVATLVLAGVLYFTTRDVPRLFVVYVFLILIALLAVWRALTLVALKHLRHGGRAMVRALIVGYGDVAPAVARALTLKLGPALEIVGQVCPPGSGAPGLTRLGDLAEVAALVRQHAIDEVVIALPADAHARIDELEQALLETPVRLRLVPDYLRLVFVQSSIETVDGIPLIGLREPKITGFAWAAKRLFDVAAAVALLIGLTPALIVIALLIKHDSPGPVIFRQRRLGENGRPFEMLKFRTMVADAESRGGEKRRDDERVTRLGRFLRRFSLDELPQLVNVLVGEMSLVGPRPEQLKIAESYAPWQRQRLAVPPGMTGWWQVNGRSDLPLHLNTHLDLYYIQNYSLWLDLVILWRTIGAVLKRQGAF